MVSLDTNTRKNPEKTATPINLIQFFIIVECFGICKVLEKNKALIKKEGKFKKT